MIFQVGDVVETTDEFEKIARHSVRNSVKGVVKFLDDEYADIMTTDNGLISVGLQWLQLYQFKIGDKVITTPAHDKRFGTKDKGIVNEVDGNYISIFTQGKHLIILHKKWLQLFEGDLLFFYKGKLV